MNVHNIMEEQVTHRVNKLYDQVKEINASWLSCDCEHCRLDTVSYVLNRVPPKYVVSGRGLTYTIAKEDDQLKADIDALAIEGIHAVSSARRPYHNQEIDKTDTVKEGPVFNFPTFIGTVYDGSTFEPLANATITLLQDNMPAKMMDYTWQNPNLTTSRTKGTFSFWIKAISSNEIATNKTFHFTIIVEASGYETLKHHFNVPVASEEKIRNSLNSTYSLKIPDLHLFPIGQSNLMED